MLLLLLLLLLRLLLGLLLMLCLLFRDRRSLVVLVWYRHRLLLDGEINQRGKGVVSWYVVMGRWWHQVQTIRRWTRWFRTGSTAADTTAGSASRVVALNDSLPLGWRWRSVRARSAENRGHPVDMISWRRSAQIFWPGGPFAIGHGKQ